MGKGLALCLLAALVTHGFAADGTPSLAERLRSGTLTELFYTAEGFANLSGGIRRGAVYEGLLDARLTLDLEKIAGFSQTKFFASVLYPHGSSLTNRYVGDFNVLSNIDAFDTLRLFELWIEKNIGDDRRRVSLRAGKLAVDSEFFVCESGSVLINSCFGALPTLGQIPTFPIWPLSSPALRIEADDGAWFVRTAVYDSDTQTEMQNRHGTRFGLHGEDGALFIGELGWRVKQNAQNAPRVSLKAGGFYSTAEFTNVRDDHPLHGNGGAYVVAEGQVIRTGLADQGLALFSRASAVPDDRNQAAWYLEGGAVYKGLAKPDDALAAAAGFTKISKDFSAENGDPAHHETVLELTYLSAPICGHLRLQPDFQYIFNPGGTKRAADAVVTGLRVILNF